MKVLVANRGEIACRILATLRTMGLPSVAVHSEVDRDSPHLDLADEVEPLGGAGYLDGREILAAAGRRGATHLHPGYGFLSQSADFAAACAAAGVAFVGPSPEAMRLLGDKRSARRTAEGCGIPVIPGAAACDTPEEAAAAAERVGYPILLKAAGGGGGKGMRRVESRAALDEAFRAAEREAKGAFADGRLLVERLIERARHVEIQVLGDGADAVALGERECSLQRRYQKVVEEAPSAGIAEATRAALVRDAVALARAARYASAGTVEFLVGPDGAHHFLEVNTRLQVEHPVTEMLTGVDLVAAQIDLARGGPLPAPPPPRGHAIEARLCAEDTSRGFLPSSGEVLLLDWPSRPGVRIDTGIRAGSAVRPEYDPLLAKIVACGPDREVARRRLVDALYGTTILGVATNLSFLIQILESDLFQSARTFTTSLEETRWEEPPVPDAARRAARRALASPAGAGPDGRPPGRRAAADGASPWASPDAAERLRP